MSENLYAAIFNKMAELEEFNFPRLWAELDSIPGSSLEKLQTVDQLISSCLVETNFNYCKVRLSQQGRKDM